MRTKLNKELTTDNLQWSMPRYLIARAFEDSKYFGEAVITLGCLRRCCPSGHIHDYRKFNVKLLGNGISYPTFVKHLKILAKKGLITTTAKVPKNIKNKDKWIKSYDFVIPSNQTIVKLYPPFIKKVKRKSKINKPIKIKLLYLENDKTLCDEVKKFCFHKKINGQKRKLQRLTDTQLLQGATPQMIVFKTCGIARSVTSTNLHNDTSLSRRHITKTLGLKHRNSVKPIIDRWTKDNFITETKRYEQIGLLSKAQEQDIAEKKYALMPRGFYYFDEYDKCWYRRWANQFQLQNEHIGRKHVN
jgi:hypothetical protein